MTSLFPAAILYLGVLLINREKMSRETVDLGGGNPRR